MSDRWEAALAPWGRRVCAVVALACAACDAGLDVRGIVVDPAGHPIHGAEIVIDGLTRDRSAANGCFSFWRLTSTRHAELPFRVQAPGFAPLDGTVSSPGTSEVLVMLMPTNTSGTGRLVRGPSGCPTH